METAGRRARRAAEIAVLAAAYFVAAKVGLMFAFLHASATAVWPPTGIAIASLLLWGMRMWPGVFIGAFVANVTTAGSAASSLGIATGNTLEAVLGAFLAARFAGGARAFERPQSALRFALLAAVGATMVSATIGVSSLWLGGHAGSSSVASIWLTWWLGDAAGALLVAPALLIWAGQPSPRWGWGGWFQAGVTLAGLVLVGQVIFGSWLPERLSHFPLAFLTIPLLTWTAVRFGPRESSAAIVVLTAIALWGTLRGLGPFAVGNSNDSLMLLQAFLGVVSLTTLVLAAAVAEMRTARDSLEARVHERTRTLSEAFEALRRSEERFRLLVDGVRDYAIFMLTPEGRIASWNAGAERMKGYGAEEILGREVAIFHEAGERESGRTARLLAEAAASGRVEDEGWRVRKDGTRFWANVVIAAVKDSGGVLRGFTKVTRDLTERLRAEEERERMGAQLLQGQKLQAIGQLSAGIAHEINNPVGWILSNLGVLREYLADLGRLDDARREALARIAAGGDAGALAGRVTTLERELDPAFLFQDFGKALDDCRRGAERIRNIVKGMKEFSHVDDGAIRSADLATLLENSIQLCWNELKYTARIRREFARVPPVPCHPQQMEQVFVNLLVNAVQALDGKGEITVRTACEGREAVIGIRDTGSGIPAENLPRLFEPFFTTKPVGKGTGLGLHVVHKIVAAHGGRIEVTSEVGKGSEFVVRLPIASAAPD